MKLAAAILAGGRAARFGHRPKGLAELGSQPVIERQLEVLEAHASPIAVVGDDLSAYASIIGPRTTMLPDTTAGAGPMAGLAAALEWTPHPWLLVVAVDLPRIGSAAIELLLSRVDERVSMVAPVVDGQLQPLAAVYNKNVRGEVTRCLEAGLLSPRRLFESEGAVRVNVDGEIAQSLRGFNTADELAAIRRDCNFPE